MDFGVLFYRLFTKLYQRYEFFSINYLIQVSLAHLTTFYGFLTGFNWKIGNKHFSRTWGKNKMLKLLKKINKSSCFKCKKTSLIPWFKCNNQNQNSSNDENNPNNETEDDILDEDEEIPRSPFFILVLKMCCRLAKLLLLKQMIQFTSFTSCISLKNKEVSLK